MSTHNIRTNKQYKIGQLSENDPAVFFAKTPTSSVRTRCSISSDFALTHTSSHFRLTITKRSKSQKQLKRERITHKFDTKKQKLPCFVAFRVNQESSKGIQRDDYPEPRR
jgi:hypothetical protein